MNLSETEAEYEAIIVGGSFAGLAAAMQLARARRKILILDTGEPRNRFATTSHGFLGQDGVSPAEILASARTQALAYPTVTLQASRATDAAQTDGVFTVTLDNGSAVCGKRLILATGVTDRLPKIPGIDELWGGGVFHCPYCHGYEVADRKLAILGSSEMSIHQALLIRDWSEDLTLLTNGNSRPIRADRIKLEARGIAIETAAVARLIPKGHELGAIEFKDGRIVPYDGLFIVPRYTLASPLAERLGCAIENTNFGPMITTNANKATTVSGVYAAGDAARPNHNVSLAVADGSTAGIFAHQSLIFEHIA